ncbi:ABC transporter ATP-binding protein [Ornithinimicrobium sp. CNJ-824]|uniref:ABC transporter ATP-binding protein n=1 Tax=Ornithinimicrobium sp. CNJ-824 TaxID=1904966 RepID=UPI001EDB3E01|nr:ABC transporter ATP-binding protein [Ornithinimicrobium sp. CNJ-824]
MLELRDVTVRFGALAAVSSVSLSVAEGDVLAVIGPSGCGKSTLLRAVAGLEPLAAGSVVWDGHDLAGVPTHERGFALMFQDGQLFNHASVAENIAYALRLRGLGRASRRGRVEELLELVGMQGYADRRPSTLSGGQQQRVALARSLAADPALLLLDEPLSALDRSLRDRLAGDLREILVQTGTTAVMVTHDHDEAFTVADRMAVMLEGEIAQEGPTGEVWRARCRGRWPSSSATRRSWRGRRRSGSWGGRPLVVAGWSPGERTVRSWPCGRARCGSTRPAGSPGWSGGR